MRKKKLIISLAMTIAVGLGVTAYASTQSTNGNGTYQRAGLGRVTDMRGYDYVEAILKNKLGMNDKEITGGLNSGKTMYDLAKEKGMTEEQFKTALLEEKNKAIDKAVTDGKITKEEGQNLKAIVKNNVDNCIGTPGQRQGRGRNGQVMGNGARGIGNCYINNSGK